MSEVLSSFMKIILGIVVLVAIVVGISLFFKNSIIGFFKNLTGIFLALIN